MHACSVTLDSLWHHALKSTRLPGPWNFPGKNSGAGCHFLLQGICPTQGLNPSLLCLLHWQADSWPLNHLGSPRSLVEDQITSWNINTKSSKQLMFNKCLWKAYRTNLKEKHCSCLHRVLLFTGFFSSRGFWAREQQLVRQRQCILTCKSQLLKYSELVAKPLIV